MLRAVRARWLLGLLGFFGAMSEGRAWALSARFVDPVAVVGEDVVVRVRVEDAPDGLVAGVEVELRVDGGQWSPVAAEGAGEKWSARFSSTEIWRGAGAPSLEARASVLGRRGGLLVELGYDFPLELEVMSPTAHRARARAFEVAASQAAPADSDGEPGLVGTVGTQLRVGDRARVRGLIGVAFGFDPRWMGAVRLALGPSFAAPKDHREGAFALGVELGLRVRAGPPSPGTWTPYAGPRVGVELAFPGVDPFAGVEAGLIYGLNAESALDLGLVGSGMLAHAIDAERDARLAFSGGLRLGLRFGAPGA